MRWTATEILVLREVYPEEDLDEVFIALPDRTMNAIRIKASRLNIKRVTPTLDIFLRIERDPLISMRGPDGQKISVKAGEYDRTDDL